MKGDRKAVSVFWFRRDLRLHDNCGLYHALKGKYPVLPVFIFDKNILNSLSEKKDRRVSFIWQALENLNSRLINLGSSLYTLFDNPVGAFSTICIEFDVKEVFTNNDYEPYAIERDLLIANLLRAKNILLHSFKDQVLFEKSEVMKLDGKPYTIFTPYSKIWKKNFSKAKPEIFSTEKFFKNFLKIQPFRFLSLKEIGFEKIDVEFTTPQLNEKVIHNYHEMRNIPSVHGTSRLSVHLRFGTISIRQLANLAIRLNEKWLNELIWREFFMMILFHFPRVVTSNFKRKYDYIKWRNNEYDFELWCKGETGYPIVDAGMRELNETGFMHNRVRMIVASFLTKHLLIDWQWGEAYFAEKLLDYELSSNNGNWQWAAGCGCDAAPYFRIFNPFEQTKRFDPEMKYVKKWIKDFDSYLVPQIVEHNFARKRALDVFKSALKSDVV